MIRKILKYWLLRALLAPFVLAFLISACQSEYQKIDPHPGSEVTLEREKNLSLLTREHMLSKLAHEHFDVLIIGGGATGAGAALDAASRGLKTALIEGNDFSFGTSSRSTKLVHGGIRYLENAVKNLDWQQYELVRDALQERQLFLNNAPHLTRPLAILTPVYSYFSAIYYWAGLKVYDLIAARASLGSSEFLSPKTALARFPELNKSGLKGAVLYYDGQFNDARMNITLILSAIREGAMAVNYVAAESLLKEQDQIIGLVVHDKLSEQSWPIYAKVVINATGPYADSIRLMDDPKASTLMQPSQGSHLLLPEKFCPTANGLVIPSTKDGRIIFLLPWESKALAGTTDLPQKITEYPRASEDEVEYILEHLRKYLSQEIKRSDVLATWSGLRPLAKPSYQAESTAAISRDHLIEISASKLITIVGGKWTTYRKMAEDLINIAIKTGKLAPQNACQTKNLKLVGARFFSPSLVEELQTFDHLEPDIAAHLSHAYGDRVDEVVNIDNKSRNIRLLKNYPYTEAEVIHALRNEYAQNISDVIARRLRLAFLDNQAALAVLPKVAQIIGQELAWDRTRLKEELDQAYEFLATMQTTAPSTQTPASASPSPAPNYSRQPRD